tara:strand:- start:224 stop:589 length:366 start_codon:yes stop_codon:yes gene_type:complete
MSIDKIIHDKFITLLDKETKNNISLLNSDLYGTLINDNDTFNFFSVADKVRDKLNDISDINNQCFYNEDMDYWYTNKNGDLIVDEDQEDILNDSKLSQIYKITPQEILSSILGNELYNTIY